MYNSNENKETEDNGFMLRSVFPQNKKNWHKAKTIGPTEEEVLVERYSALADWLSEVKVLEKRGSIELLPYLKQALAKAKLDGRIPDCSDETALRLEGIHSGPDLLLFFIRKCPHARDAILRGELPPYPWHISQSEQEQKPAEIGQQDSSSLINIQNSNVIWGNVNQSDNLQVGDHPKIQKATIMEDKKKGILKEIYKIIGAIIVGIIVAIIIDIMGDFGLIGGIKAFIYKVVSTH